MTHPAISPIPVVAWQRPPVQPMRWAIGRNDRVRIALMFASVFAFLGVMGKLLTPGKNGNLKGYYLILPIGLLTLTLLGTRATWKALLICVPIVTYLIYSGATASVALTQSRWQVGYTYSSPGILAALMLVNLSLFVVVVASHIRHASTQSKVRLIEHFLLGYLLTLGVGYVFLVGGSAGVLSRKFINEFSSTRKPESDSRFMPGCDANEYAIMTSFALTTIIAYALTGVGRRQPERRIAKVLSSPLALAVLIPMTLVALLFTSTRAAMVAFAGGTLWVLCWHLGPQLRHLRISKRWVWYSSSFVVAAATVIIPFAVWQWKHFMFISKKFSDVTEGTGTAEGRLVMWKEALENFASSPLLGYGYHSHEYIHNTWLQVICDLGILGTALLIANGAFIFAHLRCKSNDLDTVRPTSEEQAFLKYTKQIALGTVLWFGATNHNFDQFLTWFAAMLLLAL